MAAVLLAGGTVGFGVARAPTYEASVKILVGQEQPTDALGDSEPGRFEGEFQGLQQMTQTMVEAVKARPNIAGRYFAAIGLQMTPEELLENLNVEQVHASRFIRVDNEDTDPGRARPIANTIGGVFSKQVSEVSPSANVITAVVVWERAEVPNDPASPDPVRDGLVALT